MVGQMQADEYTMVVVAVVPQAPLVPVVMAVIIIPAP
jgi:hypothetical protein